jgi:hypothetical protein
VFFPHSPPLAVVLVEASLDSPSFRLAAGELFDELTVGGLLVCGVKFRSSSAGGELRIEARDARAREGGGFGGWGAGSLIRGSAEAVRRRRSARR